MIKIRLNPAAFAPGQRFADVDPKYAVLCLSTGKPESYSGVLNDPYPPTHPFFVNSTNTVPITLTGAEISDYTLEAYRTNNNLHSTFGQQLLDYMAMSLVIVEDDGVVLTTAQVATYVA